VFERVHSEKMMLALPENHPLAAAQTLPLSCLEGQDFVGFDRHGSSYFHATLQRLFREHHVRPKIVYESVLPTLLALVEAGMGAALVPESAAGLRRSGIAYRALAGGPNDFDVNLYSARQPDNANPTARIFSRILSERPIS
jgi:DNA-binding transcriptional LysR family regulator